MQEKLKEKARDLIDKFKGSDYLYGMGCLDSMGNSLKNLGDHCLLVASSPEKDRMKVLLEKVRRSLNEVGIRLATEKIVKGARPNAPREDVYRMEAEILQYDPGFLVVIGSGSTIDAAKAANALAALGKHTNDIEDYFGVGNVTRLCQEMGVTPKPLVAVMTAASSSAHLTKYSNITDPAIGQKKLIVDDNIIPAKAVFDYEVTNTCPLDLTLDGGMDGIAHSLEVYYGAKENLDEIEDIALTGIELTISGLVEAKKNIESSEARELLGLGTDLGGYAIMVGGTNGGHLTSFSLVDIVAHGRACALLNPYYTVFFTPSIEGKVKKIGDIYKRHGYIDKDLDGLNARELGMIVAQGMINFSKALGFPVKLSDVEGFKEEHITRALAAAKNPQLEMKLKNMPVPLDATLIDAYMGPILAAAKTGDLSRVKNA